MAAFALVAVKEPEVEALFEMFEAYRLETEVFDPLRFDPQTELEARQSLLAGAEDEEWFWIEVDGEHLGFLMTQTYYDEPLVGQQTTEILECYVNPAYRRRGLGRAAIDALLVREREHGTALVEAGVLSDNAEALAFWDVMGFVPRSIEIARRP